ncbi:hypothetical protein HDC92_004365 [Pedobacter sp. AK017]|uniref:FecR family protein n=1 Tax=Pedobacter sp. AK017 TaxID=2723073 RepID=UPI0016073652|nr:FecR family protein [Pedobacter sp. AK017]MBB5440662.1 hypothetical protein [Pedobacter sp. AK017]
MFDKEFDIAEIIALSQKQELTASDEQLLQQWLEADVANPVLFASLSSEDSIREKMKAFESPDSNVLWHNVISKLSYQNTQIKPQYRRLWPRIAIAAAVATIIFGAGLFYYNLNNNKAQSDQVALKNDVAPGKYGATLTLASGKRIKLSDAINGELANEAGVTISKSSDGRLIYEIKGSDTDPDKINTLSTVNGETYQVRLPDGSMVYLNAASSLTYSVNLIQNRQRRVGLSGEGYFEVAKDKAHPFIVQTDKQEVEVLGTHFNVNAYHDEKAMTTTLLEGSVKVIAGGKQRLIKPGQQARNDGSNIEVAEVNLESITDWKDGDFYLNRVNFKTAMRKIARWYDVEFVYDATVPDELESGGWISRKNNLSSVLKTIEASGFVKFRVEGNKVYVSK